MPTFIQSLKKEMDGNRKHGGYNKNSYGGNYKKNYPNQPSVNERTQKPPSYSVPLAQLEDLLGDNMISIQKLMEQVIETQKFLVENEQRRVRIESETVATLKRIADMVATVLETQSVSDANSNSPKREYSPPPPPPPPGDTLPGVINPDHYRYVTVNRKDVVKQIIAMREQGVAYRVIAEHLERNNIPTFSGRGGWHAQTIANLIKFNRDEF